MSLLDNIKSNFLGNRNSFNVTFNNKSPLSYVGSESLPGHGSSIQTQLKAPKVSDVYKAHSPKDYLAAETEKYHAIGDATEAFVNFLGKQDGLVHISELAAKRVAKVGDVVKEGDEVSVKVVGFDRGKVKLSMKQASA